jgi:hypothetical protein
MDGLELVVTRASFTRRGKCSSRASSRFSNVSRHSCISNWKEFSDLLGPLRRYLRKQVGRPWDKLWSEITQTLDSRSLTGQHIFDHIRWEVE